jgi:hypothetical protein
VDDAIAILDSLFLLFSSSYLTHILPCPPFKKSIFCFFSFLFKSEKSKLRLIATAAKTDKSQGVPQHGLVLNGVTFWDFLSIFPTVLFHFFFFFNLRIVNRNSRRGGILLSGKTSAKLFASLKIFFVDATIKRAL